MGLATGTLGTSVAFAEQGSGGGGGVSSARDHFMRGVELYQDEEYEAALAEFFRANEIAPHYGLLYNIINIASTHYQSTGKLSTRFSCKESLKRRVPSVRTNHSIALLS